MVSFGSDIAKITGDANFTRTLTTNSPGRVTYSSSNTHTASINSSTGEVTLLTPGTATITATQVPS